MVMGTASDVGKSVVVTALCRLFANAGIRVAPFKSQNMSNNAAVCVDGGEIGRAQAVQAEACGLEPTVDMNPVLLKPESDRGCQVVIRGHARFRMTTREYSHYREQAWPEIVASYARLAEQFEVIVIEGAGGAAEVNLRHRDIVNWSVAELADAPVLIIADIDKGGALAALVGTIALLTPTERQRVKGLIINKFRGDPALLYDGLKIIEQRTGVPVLGVLPHAGNLAIPEEDGAGLKAGTKPSPDRPIAIGVVVFPRISNYTDFEPFLREPDVSVQYVEDPTKAGQPRRDLPPGRKYDRRSCVAARSRMGQAHRGPSRGRRHHSRNLRRLSNDGTADCRPRAYRKPARRGGGIAVAGYRNRLRGREDHHSRRRNTPGVRPGNIRLRNSLRADDEVGRNFTVQNSKTSRPFSRRT